MDTNTDAVSFFVEHGPTSYCPDRETPEEGTRRAAEEYAAAEKWAQDNGIRYAWSVDPEIDSSDFSDETPAWKQWQCFAYSAEDECLASLGGVDFGRDGTPDGEPYARVVEAMLAEDLMGEVVVRPTG